MVRNPKATGSQFDFRTVNASLCLGEEKHFIALGKRSIYYILYPF